MQPSAPFAFDERLGIRLPAFAIPFEAMDPATQEAVIAEWESIRARIPDQIQQFEAEIRRFLEQISESDDWDQIVSWFDDISDRASRIAELNQWLRVDPGLSSDA
ncbi:MAG: hypothetical protein K6T78_02755 [Alicyclobacillus sp.]|nr:hypothetical protein [Alicyclobacillus sp.]